MTASRVLLGVLLRSVVVVVVTAVYVVAVSRSESTDALGAGLLAFLIMAVLAFGWALADGARHGFTPALLLWLFTSVVAGIGIPVVFALTETDRSVTSEIRDGALFFGVLLFVPAALGLCLGGLVHRLRGTPTLAGRGGPAQPS